MSPTDPDLPSRPRFSWDSRQVPWTDGKGNQEQYAAAVRLWKLFHDTLPAANANKIPKSLQGVMLRSQLYGQAADLCKGLTDSDLTNEAGAQKVLNCVYKRDALAVISDVYHDFMTLLTMKRGNNETFKNFEARFAAHISKFHAHCPTAQIPESLTAFMLLANSNVDGSQRVSVLAVASPSVSIVKSETETTTDGYLKAVSYASIASVLRQCDQSHQNGSRADSTTNDSMLSLHAAMTTAKKPKIKLTPAEL